MFKTIERWSAAAVGLFGDLLFPPACRICGDEVTDADMSLCPTCRERLANFNGGCCAKCGDPTAGPEESCRSCARHTLHFDGAVSLGLYEGLLRDVVLRMKHPQEEGLAAAIGDWLAARHAEKLGQWRVDLVVAVPHHWSRWLRTPASSPATMGRCLARRLGRPLLGRGLVCTRKVKPQHTLRLHDRFRNVHGAMRVAVPARVAGKNILLVDDILTTGATCSEAARVLKAAGAAWIGVAVAARARGDLHLEG